MRKNAPPVRLNMVPLASALLILTLAAFVVRYPTPHGELVKVARSARLCGDMDPYVVLEVDSHGTVKLNKTAVKGMALEMELHGALLNRADRLVLIKADPASSFQEVACLIDAAHRHADLVALLSPEVEELEGCLEFSPPPGLPQPKPLIDIKPVPLWAWSS